MAETKDERKHQDQRAAPEQTNAELKRELIEALARTYFGMCRKLARLLNR